MLRINISGWNHAAGLFSIHVSFDDQRSDWSIIQASGRELKQVTGFESIVRDWNNDGDVYERYGAFFESPLGREFLTPEDMVQLVIDEKAIIPGLPDPLASVKEQAQTMGRDEREGETAPRQKTAQDRNGDR